MVSREAVAMYKEYRQTLSEWPERVFPSRVPKPVFNLEEEKMAGTISIQQSCCGREKLDSDSSNNLLLT